MERRYFLRNTGIMVTAGLLLQKKALAQIFNLPEFKLTMLRKNVGIYTERGGTIGFLLTPNGIVTIDSQFADTATNYINEVKKTSTSPLRFLLNTHHHGDHTSGNISFKGLVENVVAHENSLANQKKVAEAQNSMDKQLLPDMTFKDEWKLKIGNEKIKASYYGAGHTNGDAVYHFEEANIMHVGDLMFNRRHPFVDRSAGANMTSWTKVLDKIIKSGDKNTLYIFGHSLNPGGETGTAEDLKKFQDYLGKVLAFTEQEIKAGKSKEEFIKNTAVPGVTEWQGQGLERPLTAAYEELTEAKKA
jgi:glyoxylase-like metal-dependent hydrolase (beta-lactamase superfamily II)